MLQRILHAPQSMEGYTSTKYETQKERTREGEIMGKISTRHNKPLDGSQRGKAPSNK